MIHPRWMILIGLSGITLTLDVLEHGRGTGAGPWPGHAFAAAAAASAAFVLSAWVLARLLARGPRREGA